RALRRRDHARHHRRQPRVRQGGVPETGVPRRHDLRGDRDRGQARVEVAAAVGHRHLRAPREEPARRAGSARPPQRREPDTWERMNPIATGLGRDDLAETIAGRPTGYVVPKPRHAGDVREIAQVLDGLEHRHGIPHGRTRLVLIATETPEGLLNIREVSVASPRVVTISWGIEDLGAAMGLPRVRDERGKYLDIPRYARTMCAIAASAAGVDALDTVYTDIADLDGLRRECEDGVAMGFSGKISIHPSQIAVINEVFTPSKEAVAAARELVAAFAAHAARGAYA